MFEEGAGGGEAEGAGTAGYCAAASAFVLQARKYGRGRWLIEMREVTSRHFHVLTTLPSTAKRAAARSTPLSDFGRGGGGAVNECSFLASERVMNGSVREARASRSADIFACSLFIGNDGFLFLLPLRAVCFAVTTVFFYCCMPTSNCIVLAWRKLSFGCIVNKGKNKELRLSRTSSLLKSLFPHFC